MSFWSAVMVERCLSSQLLSGLLTWRNPHGTEENWYFEPPRGTVFNSPVEVAARVVIHAAKVLTAEAGIATLTVMAATETVAYSALGLVSLTFYFYNDRPAITFYKLLQSSSFTILWGSADALIFNIFFYNIFTHESLARFYINDFLVINPLYRHADQVYIADLRANNQRAQHPMLRSVHREGMSLREKIAAGAAFLKNEIFARESNDTRNLCKECDPEIYQYILAKAISLYAIGAKRNETVPRFFKNDTQDAIQIMRTDFPDGPITQDVLNALTDPARFEAGVQNPEATEAFTRLRNIGSMELQNSLFITRCWQAAIA